MKRLFNQRYLGYPKSSIRKEGNRSEIRCGFSMAAMKELDGEAGFHSGNRKNFAILKFCL